MCLFYVLMCLCVRFLKKERKVKKRRRFWGRSADERLFMVNREYVIFLSLFLCLSFSLSLLLVLCPSEPWLSLFSEMKDARHGASIKSAGNHKQTFKWRTSKALPQLLASRVRGKIGSLRPKNDIVYINRGPWLDATMFVMLCCPPSLLPLPTGHFSPPPHNRSFEGFLFADKERKNGTTKKRKQGRKG